MYRVGGRGRVACIELEGTGLHVSSSRWKGQGRDKVACIQFEPELDRELSNSDSDPDSTSTLVTQHLDLELELKLSN